MATKTWAIALVVFTTLLTSSAQLMYKEGMNNFSFSNILTNYWLFAGAATYVIGAVILLIALKGGELSVLYPIIATSYIWVCLLSVRFGEVMNPFKWVGVVAIVLGVSLIGIGGRK
jgi:drug/metabolite transporter (DMT)-like permease